MPSCFDMSDFTSYMVHHERVRTGLTRFDNWPENYSGFMSTIKADINYLNINYLNYLNIPSGDEYDINWLYKFSRPSVLTMC